MKKVIIAGSRGITDYEEISYHLDIILPIYHDYHDPIEIVSGGARGVDSLAEKYAKERDIPFKEFLADWDNKGKSAGYLRNEEMAKYSDAAIIFWDGESKGTKHMIDLSLKYKLDLHLTVFKVS